MRLHFFTVPVHDPGAAQDDLNRFLAGHRVASIDRELIAQPGGAVWAVCVTVVGESRNAGPSSKKGRIDYREILPEAQFRVYARLRALRKELAQRDGVPPYAVFTNEQLAAIVTGGVTTAAELTEIPGVGPARMAKYGEPMLALARSQQAEAEEAAVDGNGLAAS